MQLLWEDAVSRVCKISCLHLFSRELLDVLRVYILPLIKTLVVAEEKTSVEGVPAPIYILQSLTAAIYLHACLPRNCCLSCVTHGIDIRASGQGA